MPKFKILPLLACLTLVLTGCSALQSTNQEPAHSDIETTQKTTPPPAEFEPETLYTLLVAELAGQRQRYDVLLSNYLSAAKKTRDPGLAERATRIAASIKAQKATLAAAQLWLEVDPQNPQAKQVLAAQLVQAGQLDNALTLFEELLNDTGHANFESLATQSQRLSQKQRNELITGLDRLLKNHPENAQLLTAKTILLQLNGRSDEALNSAETLHRLENNTHSLSLKAKLHHQLGHTELALKELKQSLKKTPDNKVLRVLYAQMLIDDKQLTLAQEQFEFLINKFPQDDQIRLTLALLQLENDHLEEGDRNLEQLLQNPGLADEAHYFLGQSAEKANHVQKAIEHYRQVTGGSKFLPAYHRLGTLLLDQDKTATLKTLFTNARQAQPAQGKSLYIIEAELLNEKQLTHEAMLRLNEALQEYPADINLLYTRAMTAEKTNDLVAMENDLRAILSQEPDNAMVLNALGYTLADRTTRYQEALSLISRAMELKPDDPAITDSLGWAQFRLGNYEEAIRLLEQAHADFPDHEVAAHLGEALWTVGQQQRARKIWKEALQKQPDSPILMRVIERFSPDLKP